MGKPFIAMGLKPIAMELDLCLANNAKTNRRPCCQECACPPISKAGGSKDYFFLAMTIQSHGLGSFNQAGGLRNSVSHLYSIL